MGISKISYNNEFYIASIVLNSNDDIYYYKFA